MTGTQTIHRGFNAWTASGLVGGLAFAIVGLLFMSEGLMGYFYNSSMFWEGLDHIWLIYGGLAVAVVGGAVAILALLRR